MRCENANEVEDARFGLEVVDAKPGRGDRRRRVYARVSSDKRAKGERVRHSRRDQDKRSTSGKGFRQRRLQSRKAEGDRAGIVRRSLEDRKKKALKLQVLVDRLSQNFATENRVSNGSSTVACLFATGRQTVGLTSQKLSLICDIGCNPAYSCSASSYPFTEAQASRQAKRTVSSLLCPFFAPFCSPISSDF